jgi:hypothetical protein
MTVWSERALTVVMTLGLMSGMAGAALVIAWGGYRLAFWCGLLP